MYYSEGTFPHDKDDIPHIKDILVEVDWDVVCVLDACRWDAFETMVGMAEPVKAPSRNTPLWTKNIWCDPEIDWSDVTYVTGNAHVTEARNFSEGPNDGVIENHVGEYIEAFKDDEVWDGVTGSSLPDSLTGKALGYEPPLVVHYVQPHTPFIGNVSFSVNGTFDQLPLDSYDDPGGILEEYSMVDMGLVSPNFIRLAYLENLREVWACTRPLLENFEKVLFTADHGEILGPEEFQHGDKTMNQTMVVPCHFSPNSWVPELPEPAEVGAVEGYDWLYDWDNRVLRSEKNKPLSIAMADEPIPVLGTPHKPIFSKSANVTGGNPDRVYTDNRRDLEPELSHDNELNDVISLEQNSNGAELERSNETESDGSDSSVEEEEMGIADIPLLKRLEDSR